MRAHTKTGPSTSRDSWRCCRPLQQQPLPPPPFKPKQKHINQSFYSHFANNKIIIIINMNFILFICFALIHVSCPPKLRYQVEQTNTNGVWSELFSGACVCFGSFENGFSGHSSSSDHDLTQSIIEFVAPIISANFCEKAWFHIGMHSAIYYFFFSVFVPKRKNRATTKTGSQIELDFCSEKFGLDWHAFNGENKKPSILSNQQSTSSLYSRFALLMSLHSPQMEHWVWRYGMDVWSASSSLNAPHFHIKLTVPQSVRSLTGDGDCVLIAMVIPSAGR